MSHLAMPFLILSHLVTLRTHAPQHPIPWHFTRPPVNLRSLDWQTPESLNGFWLTVAGNNANMSFPLLSTGVKQFGPTVLLSCGHGASTKERI